MVEHNRKKVTDLKQPVALIKSSNSPKSEASGDSADRQSGLPANIILCRGTKFRLTSNLWTAAGLTNGAKGVVHGIIYKEGSQPPALPAAVIATFDSYTGPPWRTDLPGLTEKAIPICPETRGEIHQFVSHTHN